MNPYAKGCAWCSQKTGLTVRMIEWSIASLVFMLLFIILFTIPQNIKIKQLDEENALAEVHLQEQVLLEMLNLKLTKIIYNTYPEVERINAEAFLESDLLDLPTRFEDLAALLGVTLVSIDSSSVDDGAQVAIHTIFQGEMEQMYTFLKKIGRVKYAKRLTSMTVLSLPDTEQMELKFKVPIQ
jgi:hypothetical protein